MYYISSFTNQLYLFETYSSQSFLCSACVTHFLGASLRFFSLLQLLLSLAYVPLQLWLSEGGLRKMAKEPQSGWLRFESKSSQV